MSNSSLTVRDAVRYSNHDLLNHLHLIQMNLDLNRVDAAKDHIQKVVAECSMRANINKLGLPQTIEWLYSAPWRFKSFVFEITSDVEVPIDEKWDETIEQYLEKTIIHVYDTLDPFKEQTCTIHLKTNALVKMVEVKLDGAWQLPNEEIENTKLTIVTNEKTSTSWHYVLSIKE